MKKALVVFVVVAAFASPVFAGIQKGQFEISPTIGGSLPVGDVSDLANPGFLVGGRLGYNVTARVSIGAAVNFNSFGLDNRLKNSGSDLDITSVEYLGDVRLLLGNLNSAVPYFKGLIGSAKAELGASNGSLSETETAYGAGAGFLFKSDSNIRGYFEAVYISIATSISSSTYISLRAGVSLFIGGRTGG